LIVKVKSTFLDGDVYFTVQSLTTGYHYQPIWLGESKRLAIENIPTGEYKLLVFSERV
jgi:hypothetical protein